MQKLLTFFSKNISVYAIFNESFNNMLTNDIVSFEQLGPGSLLFALPQRHLFSCSHSNDIIHESYNKTLCIVYLGTLIRQTQQKTSTILVYLAYFLLPSSLLLIISPVQGCRAAYRTGNGPLLESA